MTEGWYRNISLLLVPRTDSLKTQQSSRGSDNAALVLVITLGKFYVNSVTLKIKYTEKTDLLVIIVVLKSKIFNFLQSTVSFRHSQMTSVPCWPVLGYSITSSNQEQHQKDVQTTMFLRAPVHGLDVVVPAQSMRSAGLGGTAESSEHHTVGLRGCVPVTTFTEKKGFYSTFLCKCSIFFLVVTYLVSNVRQESQLWESYLSSVSNIDMTELFVSDVVQE